MKKPTLVVAVAVFAAASALWLAPQASAQAAAAGRIIAQPVASGRIIMPGLLEELQASDMSLALILNRAGDRVGGRASVCGLVTTVAPRRMRSCQDILFAFPGLRYDPARKAVLFGEEVLARDRGFWRGGWQIEDGFSPEFRLVKQTEDDGLEQTTQQSLELALVRKAQPGLALAQR